MTIQQLRHLSRRAAVAHLGFGGLATLLAFRPAGAVEIQGAPAAGMQGTVPPLLAEWAAAWTSHDPDRLVALYTPDAVYEEVPTGSVARGHEDIRALIEASHAAFAGITVTPRSGFQAEDWAVLEGDFAARSAEGRPITVPFAVILELEGTTIRRSADYFDLNAVLTQIAGTPAAEETASTPGSPAV